MSCKGMCIVHKAIKPQNNNRYILGHKRCQVCSIWIEWDGLFCPCCSQRLRTKPRKKQDKKVFNSKIALLNEIPR